MLNPHVLNCLALNCKSDDLNYPLTWGKDKPGHDYIRFAWEFRNPQPPLQRVLDVPIAIPATYQDHRMIAQRSCFSIHGERLQSITELIKRKRQYSDLSDCLCTYEIDNNESLIEALAVLGVTGSTIFPDLDHLGRDLASELRHR